MGKLKANLIGDFYWSHADLLRGVGVNSSGYDERILAFTAIKLLIDNNKVNFNFDYNKNFGLSDIDYKKYHGSNLIETFLNIVSNIDELSNSKNKYLLQPKKINNTVNHDDTLENVLIYIPIYFDFKKFMTELGDEGYFKFLLDIYNSQANFIDFPKDKYKDLYETTISRMRSKAVGDFVGEHFTQEAIVDLICEYAYSNLKNQKTISIYDPSCGVGSMLMESYYYLNKKNPKFDIKVYGQEINPKVWLLSKIFLEISDIPNEIACGNTLTNPAYDYSFDLIIANPPFGVDWKLIKSNKIPKFSI